MANENGQAMSEFDRGRLVEQIHTLSERVRNVEDSTELENEKRRDSSEGLRQELAQHKEVDASRFATIETQLKTLFTSVEDARRDTAMAFAQTRTTTKWVIGLLATIGLGVLALIIKR